MKIRSRRAALMAFACLGTCLGAGLCVAEAHAEDAPIDVTVDVTNAPSRIIHTRMSIPVKAGAMTMLYPRWTTTEHFPSGIVTQLSGLTFRQKGQALGWRRDLTDLDTFHVAVPEDGMLEVEFDYMLPLPATGRANSSARLLMLRWNNVLLYPGGKPIRDIIMRTHLKLPAGWGYGTALPVTGASASSVDFAAKRFDTIVDTPVLAGQFMRSVPLGSGKSNRYWMDVAAESPDGLDVPEETIAGLGRVIAQSRELFSTEHFADYHFLVAASDFTSQGGGMEHSDSSDVRVAGNYFSNPLLQLSRYNFFSHEYAHSWNAKFRLPENQLTDDSQTPMRNDLLWVHEGLTTYLGNILGARAGLCPPEYCRDHIAVYAAGAMAQTGRTWRPLQDTADATAATMFADFSVPTGWESRHREMDFYNEGVLIWLEVDATIRKRTGGKRSLDDFVSAFFGGDRKFPEISPYNAEDVYAGLSAVLANDWRGFFESRLQTLSPQPPLGGIETSGWRLVFNDQANVVMANMAERTGLADAKFTLGLVAGKDGEIVDVILGSAAGKAGLFPGATILRVNGQPWSAKALDDAVRSSPAHPDITISASFAGQEKDYALAYSGGPRFPHLERAPGKADLLTPIQSAR